MGLDNLRLIFLRQRNQSQIKDQEECHAWWLKVLKSLPQIMQISSAMRPIYSALRCEVESAAIHLPETVIPETLCTGVLHLTQDFHLYLYLLSEAQSNYGSSVLPKDTAATNRTWKHTLTTESNALDCLISHNTYSNKFYEIKKKCVIIILKIKEHYDK